MHTTTAMGNEKKKQKIIKWDEITIAAHDKERGTRYSFVSLFTVLFSSSTNANFSICCNRLLCLYVDIGKRSMKRRLPIVMARKVTNQKQKVVLPTENYYYLGDGKCLRVASITRILIQTQRRIHMSTVMVAIMQPTRQTWHKSTRSILFSINGKLSMPNLCTKSIYRISNYNNCSYSYLPSRKVQQKNTPRLRCKCSVVVREVARSHRTPPRSALDDRLPTTFPRMFYTRSC